MSQIQSLKEAISNVVLQRLGTNARLKFKGDNTTYYVKNISPDQKGVFVTKDNGIGTWRKSISNITSIDGKPLTEHIGRKVQYVSIIDEAVETPLIASPKSSNVKQIKYFPQSKILQIFFTTGRGYEYKNVNDELWNKIRNGEAAAVSDGENEFGKWWKGKKPSWGAAVHVFLVGNKIDYKRIK
jgi:hypothetical protein